MSDFRVKENLMQSSPRRSGKTTSQRAWMAQRGKLPDDAPPPQCRVCRAPMLCSAYILEVEGGFWEPVFIRSCGCGLPASHQVYRTWGAGPAFLWSVPRGTPVRVASCIIVDEAEIVIDATAEIVEG